MTKKTKRSNSKQIAAAKPTASPHCMRPACRNGEKCACFCRRCTTARDAAKERMLKALERPCPPTQIAEVKQLPSGAMEVTTYTVPAPVLSQVQQAIEVQDKRGSRVVLLSPGSPVLDEQDKRARPGILLRIERDHGLRLIDGGSLTVFHEIVRKYYQLLGARPSLLEYFGLCGADGLVQRVCPHEECDLPRCWSVEGLNHTRLGAELKKLGRSPVSERTMRAWIAKSPSPRPAWACELRTLSIRAEESRVKAKSKKDK